MIKAFFVAVWESVRRWALTVVADLLDWIGVKVYRVSKALTEAADAVRAKA